MKPIAILLFVSLIASCTEKTDLNKIPENTLPESFSQKVLLERNSGAWHGWCPSADVVYIQLKEKYGTLFESVVYHKYSNGISETDKMDIAEDNLLYSSLFTNIPPSGVVNRLASPSSFFNVWGNQVDPIFKERALCGLSVDARDSGYIHVRLGTAGTNLYDSNYYITVILYETEMSGIGIGWDQANWSSHDGGGSDTSHPYYNFPVNIEGYRHPNVVRQILNKESVLGDPISEDTLYARTEYSFEYKYDIATLTDDMKVLVIMHQRDVDPTSGAIFSFVYNIQFTEIGSLQGYD